MKTICSSGIVAASVALLAAVHVARGDVCDTRPTLKLYSGYSSRGQGHLQDAVRELQKLLNTKGGFTLATDGFFGSGTDSAVRTWQARSGVTSDGSVGPITWGTLCKSSNPPSESGGSACNTNNPHAASKTYSAGGWTPRTIFIVNLIKTCYHGKFSINYQGRMCTSGSDHCFGNAIDVFPGPFALRATGQDKIDGDMLAEWMRVNAGPLKVKYIIWYKRIWSVARSSEGWRSYTRYGTNPGATLGHYDHLHVSMY